MRLAKQQLDVGFVTADWDRSQAFWRDEVGLAYEEFLKIGGGVRQHRFGCHGSVVKVNHAREARPAAATVLRGVRIASDRVTAPTMLHEPEGTPVELVPPGHDGVVGIEIFRAVADEVSARRFWVDGLGATEEEPGRYRVGTTLVRCVLEPELAPMTDREAPGFRYLTVQIWDVDVEHVRMVDLGFTEEWPPTTLGTTARVSFVRDPDGGFLELSQRANLTGPVHG